MKGKEKKRYGGNVQDCAKVADIKGGGELLKRYTGAGEKQIGVGGELFGGGEPGG